MTMARIAVMGAGVLGLCAAFRLAQRGARITVVERAHPGAGASGGVVGALAPHVPEGWNAKKQVQFESLLAAAPFWAGVARIGGGDPGYARLGRVQPLTDKAAIDRARARAEGARTHWQGHGLWQVVPAGSLPGLRLRSPSGQVVHDTLSARISPRGAVAALVAALRRLEATLETGSAPPPRADAVIWATGADGLADLGRDLGTGMGAAVKGQAARLACDMPGAPQIFADGLHIVPHADGTVAIGSTSERAFDDPEATDDQLDALIARARRVCPDLAASPVVERWAGLRARAPSRAPILGPWPGRPGHYVLNGGFKIGFALAPFLADRIADLVLDGRDTIPEGFRVSDNLRP
ncbi:FAD-binding oxidoreductase [Pararhodobacter sp. SW119]|uniref:NAD(P)/FAD-dependent oxidoreductase n=1 Tax=Pararhodobacter sp. SW119 TaxID=2780075 RepID=UPI001ADED8EE|nr:FAD-binding oxidoreductase [Pararhodobacter sp. SW119]